MNTTENNKLIAEFMEYPYHFTDKDIECWEVDVDELFTKEELEFHSSWNWLIPVLYKINKTKLVWVVFDEGGITLTNIKTQKDTFYEGDGLYLIEAAHKAVIEFINWYNENK